MQLSKKRAIFLGLAASLLFSITFILNRLMSLHGGGWIWSASLRFYWMLPFFLIIVACQRGLKGLLAEIKKDFGAWLVWSTIGFGFFYAPLTFAAAYTPSWLLASTWQVTIIAGIILAPFINRNASGIQHDFRSSVIFSGIILLGIIIMQVRHAQIIPAENILKGVTPVIIAAFAYPLGNRKMMQLTNGRLNVYQRVLGMILCSMPFWFILNIYEIVVARSTPSVDQYLQTLVVAVFSGVLATILFFSATDKARADEKQLAAVEATQSTEVLFALIGEVVILGSALPDAYGVAGIALVMLGMTLHSLKS
ncbi:multidrug resistance efflux transporter family protein [Mucilaginibacter gynuensis]